MLACSLVWPLVELHFDTSILISASIKSSIKVVFSLSSDRQLAMLLNMCLTQRYEVSDLVKKVFD